MTTRGQLRCVLVAMLAAGLFNSLAALPSHAALDDASVKSRRAALLSKVMQAVEQLRAKLNEPRVTISTRDLANAAFAELEIKRDSADASAFIDKLLSSQVTDPTDPNYGLIPFYAGDRTPSDNNGLEFALQPIWPLLIQDGSQLPSAEREKLVSGMRMALNAVRRHPVVVGYTNIYLMQSINLIMLGQALHDSAAGEDGLQRLKMWEGETQQFGIHEFGSPTYYGADLHTLTMAYRDTNDPALRATFGRILDLFWRDMAANEFLPRGDLSGPHSRDYFLLTGGGDGDDYLYLEGFADHLGVDPAVTAGILAYVGTDAKSYKPAESILALASQTPRVVEQRWGPDPSNERYNYVTDDFALGSTSGIYGTEDKLVNLELAGPFSMPAISIVADSFDEPYGLEDSGVNRVHLPTHYLSVQREGALLVLVALDGRYAHSVEGNRNAVTSLALNVLLPGHPDQLAVDGTPVDLASGAIPLDIGRTVALRVGKAAVALRVIAAAGALGQAPKLVLQSDGKGAEKGAARLSVYAYRGPATNIPDRNLHFGIVMDCQHVDGKAEFAAFVDRTRNDVVSQSNTPAGWVVDARLGGHMLEAAWTVKNAVIDRRADGQDLGSPFFDVNGVPQPSI